MANRLVKEAASVIIASRGSHCYKDGKPQFKSETYSKNLDTKVCTVHIVIN